MRFFAKLTRCSAGPRLPSAVETRTSSGQNPKMMANTAVLLGGHAILLVLFGSLWLYVPAPGAGKPRWAGTQSQTAVLVAFGVAFAMALAMVTGGYLNLFS